MRLIELFKQIDILIKKLEIAILFICVVVLSLILVVNVVARKAGTSIYFIDEIAMFLVIWMSFVGLSYATRKGQNVCMSAIFDICSFKVKKILIYTNSAISALVMFYLAYISSNYVYLIYHFQQVTSALRIPYWIVVIIVPVGFSLTGVQCLLTIVQNIKIKEEVWISPEQKDEYI